MTRTIQQAILRAVKTANCGHQPPTLRFPRGPRPAFTLTVDRTGQHPEPGTLELDDDGLGGRVYVGRLRFGIPLRKGTVADDIRKLTHIEIVSTTGVAGTDARAWLGKHWKLEDVIASGLLPPGVTANLLRK